MPNAELFPQSEISQNDMKILHLTLKKKWFDMIASGEKKEEYRDTKPYWKTRFVDKHFDAVQFRNGYAKDAPKITVEIYWIDVAFGLRKWGGDPNHFQYVIKLGKILSSPTPSD